LVLTKKDLFSLNPISSLPFLKRRGATGNEAGFAVVVNFAIGIVNFPTRIVNFPAKVVTSLTVLPFLS